MIYDYDRLDLVSLHVLLVVRSACYLGSMNKNNALFDIRQCVLSIKYIPKSNLRVAGLNTCFGFHSSVQLISVNYMFVTIGWSYPIQDVKPDPHSSSSPRTKKPCHGKACTTYSASARIATDCYTKYGFVIIGEFVLTIHEA